jgi:hypothetical protein
MLGTEELLAELNLLVKKSGDDAENLHEVHFRVIELMNQLRATGGTVPEDLIRFERELTRRVEKKKR